MCGSYSEIIVKSEGSCIHARKSGFSLIEAAIVLGVVGLVIGGIWISAATVMRSLSVSRTAQGIMAAATYIHARMDISSVQSLADGTAVDSYIIYGKFFPSDWVSGSSLVSPLGNSISVTTNLGGGSDPTLWIIFWNVPVRDCIDLLNKIRFPQTDNREEGVLRGIRFAAWGDYIPQPYSLADVNNYCFTDQHLVFVVNLAAH